MNKETAEKIALIAEMRKRMTFSVGRQLFAESGFPKGRTWDDIVT